jgi:hypothetical protein
MPGSCHSNNPSSSPTSHKTATTRCSRGLRENSIEREDLPGTHSSVFKVVILNFNKLPAAAQEPKTNLSKITPTKPMVMTSAER